MKGAACCTCTSTTSLTDEHEEMIEAIRARDVSLADRLAHAHSRQFRDNFLEFLKANYSAPIDFGAERP